MQPTFELLFPHVRRDAARPLRTAEAAIHFCETFSATRARWWHRFDRAATLAREKHPPCGSPSKSRRSRPCGHGKLGLHMPAVAPSPNPPATGCAPTLLKAGFGDKVSDHNYTYPLHPLPMGDAEHLATRSCPARARHCGGVDELRAAQGSRTTKDLPFLYSQAEIRGGPSTRSTPWGGGTEGPRGRRGSEGV